LSCQRSMETRRARPSSSAAAPRNAQKIAPAVQKSPRPQPSRRRKRKARSDDEVARLSGLAVSRLYVEWPPRDRATARPHNRAVGHSVRPTFMQTLLIVDDDPDLGFGLASALECDGRRIIVCRDLESAQTIL